MQSINTSPFHLTMLRKFNVWYSIMDGNFSDPSIWMSNGKRKNNYPQPGDNIYINHNVTADISFTVNDLYVNGYLKTAINGVQIIVNGDLQTTGTIDFTENNTLLQLNGAFNSITTFIAGNSSVQYNRKGSQNVMSLSYHSLAIYNMGIKYLCGDTIVYGALNINDYQNYNAALECLNYDLTVYGSTSINASNGNGYCISKSGSGTLLFIGNCQINANPTFSSNTTAVEFRNGSSLSGFNGVIIFNCPVIFTTNNQTISGGGAYYNAAITIVGAIIVTNTCSSFYIHSSINGTVSASTLINNNVINVCTTTSLMSTGTFNYMNTTGSTMSYEYMGNIILPYSVYANLTILGTGVKTLSSNTIINKNLAINNYEAYKARLDCVNYDLTITGNTNITGTGATNDAGLLKTGAGTVVFIGSATFNTAYIGSASNVTFEFRNGVNFALYGTPDTTINGPVNFTTNSQNLQGTGVTINGAVTISGGITLSLVGGAPYGHSFNGGINGADGSDTLICASGMSYNYSIVPMQIGAFNTNITSNTVNYSLSNNQDIAGGTYRNLMLAGNGIKKLLGNVSVVNTYALVAPATLNTNGFALTNP